jgi:hypothetical protein
MTARSPLPAVAEVDTGSGRTGAVSGGATASAATMVGGWVASMEAGLWIRSLRSILKKRAPGAAAARSGGAAAFANRRRSDRRAVD